VANNVPELVRVQVADPGCLGDPDDHAVDPVTVQRPAGAIDQQQPVGVVALGGLPLAEQFDQLGVEGDVAVVVQLPDRDPQPVRVSELDHGIGSKTAQFTGSHAGAGQQFHNQSAQRVGVGLHGSHQLGEAAVV
jgi:hypothetical protein